MEFHDLLESWVSVLNEYKYFFISAILALLLGFGGMYWYRAHCVKTEQSANEALVACLAINNAATGESSYTSNDTDLSFKTPHEKWERLALVAQESYAQYSSAGIAGVFLALRAQALTHLGKHEEARLCMKEASEQGARGPVREWYRLFAALRDLDDESSVIQAQGLAELTTIAASKEHLFAHAALAELGEYHWAHDNDEQAQSYWNMLAVLERASEQSSPWYQRIKPKLKLLQV